MTIAITGANGKLGSLIISRLLQKLPPDSIIACVRQPETAKPFEKQGVQVRFCDYDQPDSLSQAFDGIAKLLVISSSHRDDTVRLRQHAHVIEAAKMAKVERLFYTSFAFLGEGSMSLAHLHLATEHAIRTTGIPYTILRNGLYADFVQALDLEAAIQKGELCTYPGDWQFNSVTREDLAAGITATLTGYGHENKTYELAAPAAWTFTELAAVLSELADRPISWRQDPGIVHWLYGFLGKIDTSSTSADLERLIGRPVMSLKETVRSFLSQKG